MEKGIGIGLPEGSCGRLAVRSGMASKIGIAVGGGVRDTDYSGEVKVILPHHGQAECLLKAGDGIAQLRVERIADADAIEADDPGTTQRGNGGFWVKRAKPQGIHPG